MPGAIRYVRPRARPFPLTGVRRFVTDASAAGLADDTVVTCTVSRFNRNVLSLCVPAAGFRHPVATPEPAAGTADPRLRISRRPSGPTGTVRRRGRNWTYRELLLGDLRALLDSLDQIGASDEDYLLTALAVPGTGRKQVYNVTAELREGRPGLPPWPREVR